MISVLTLTYKRHHLLEEAIQSYLSQLYIAGDHEMVIINDNPEVDYVISNSYDDPAYHTNVRIINHKVRFPSIAAKLEWGYKQCLYPYIYRLDDDDLLAKWALRNTQTDILANPDYDVYRSKGMYFFVNNKYEDICGSTNNGNVYQKTYLDRIKFPDSSFGEDADITFGNNSKVYQSELRPTMCYRWGMNTLHVSGMGENSNETILTQADKVLNNTIGTIELHPKFLSNYYEQIDKIYEK